MLQLKREMWFKSVLGNVSGNHPSPWTEGFVVRFWKADGNEWVGNFQGKQDWSTKVLLWQEANSVVVLAMDNFYLVDANIPGN